MRARRRGVLAGQNQWPAMRGSASALQRRMQRDPSALAPRELEIETASRGRFTLLES
jgi:hypothetical protein